MNRYLDAEEINKFLPMSVAIKLMKDAFSAISSGKAVIPVRQNLAIQNYSGNSLMMPCYLPGSGYYGIKIANVFLNNPRSQLPTIQSIYHLFDEKNGSLLLSLNGGMLTKIRTAAASALASQLMHGKPAFILALFGTGIQAESHMEAMCTIAEIKKVLIFSRNTKNARQLIEKVQIKYPLQYIIAESKPLLQEADIICTTTPSTSALFKKEHLKVGAHINAIGSFKPEMIEVPPAVLSESAIVVDQYEGAFEEAGEIIQAIKTGLLNKNDVQYELGEIVSKKKTFQRKSKSFTLFKSVGNAIQDLICAKYIYESHM